MQNITPKFWIIDDLWSILHQVGISPRWSDLFTFIAACAMLALLVWVVDIVLVRLALSAVKTRSKLTKSNLDDILVETKFFSRLFKIIPVLVILFSDNIIFRGFSLSLIDGFDLVVKAILVVLSLLVVYSLLETLNRYYSMRPESSRKSIKGYVQVTKIILGFAATIIVVSILLRKDPSNLFVGLGATAALLSLVFRDTILGFVASIQLSAQDMVRPGDWIEMPSKNADGTVLDINVNSVKILNWDNTVTMIPIYSMVSESFTNWRAMELSEGRRFVRTIFINIESVRFAGDELLESLQGSPITSAYFDEFVKLARKSSPTVESVTNLALMRANIEVFLRSHPSINDELPLYVRYKSDFTDKGIGVEIYAFSREKQAAGFDGVQRSVVEYVIGVAPLFGVMLFQSPSGRDFARK